MSIDRLLDEGYLQELECGNNYALVLSDEASFLATEYKIMKGQAESYLCSCTKVLFNGKTELYYLLGSLKPFDSICYSLDSAGFTKVVGNVFDTIQNVKNNGFLHLSKAVFSLNKIMVDSSTYKVKLIYVPVKKSIYLDDDTAESELKASIIKYATNADNLTGDRSDKLISILSNGTLSTEDICTKLRVSGNETSPQAPKAEPSRKKQRTARLISSSLDTHMEIPITKSGFVIGKNASIVDAQIVNPTLSRMHCKIEFEDGVYYIIDLNSTNGTYINGKKISSDTLYTIEDGDTITLANIDFVIKIEEGEYV